MTSNSKISMFYGKECPHCHRMMPVVERLKKEEGIEVEYVEVWHDQDNARRMRAYREQLQAACGGVIGVPAFIEPRSGSALCGEQSYEVLKDWAKKAVSA